jgi:hydroxymethylbilane synthase
VNVTGGRQRPLRLGTRGSRLALAQAALVAEALEAHGVAVELVQVVTEGDRRRPDTTFGEGIFVAALERDLRSGEVDLAVHSAKDMPIEEPSAEGDLVVAAYPERVDPRDVLVTAAGRAKLLTLPRGARVGTDSPRRTGFVLAVRPDLQVVPLTGNVDTRLRRLAEGAVDALVLAAAGLERLGHGDRIDERLDPMVVPPAPGQGALAVQVRASDRRAREAVAAIDDPLVRLAVTCERAVLRSLGGGCRAPVGALAAIAGEEMELTAGSVAPDGTGRRTIAITGSTTSAASLATSAFAWLRAPAQTAAGTVAV